ncbi:hypothetical protein Tc00.1047053507927.80 [Trypanosoma cruzi]|uniref:Uncharacterized protein n=1 Tax=Trypanosoma cruzi (strain CL Brener) TaxID=353153 RepID=Q4D584_TRYCC|nr:hypothetical protein Tc00.1047053507927.80 [Trypanosoma cruzi]EAN87691.1 hypothetical protein Tc00.1047053507927.80 [Trypanosoma cruzi]|eukprot:XP_809542.1 hypothetical protein [Trypanosoma cruzi strain CL Brener]
MCIYVSEIVQVTFSLLPNFFSLSKTLSVLLFFFSFFFSLFFLVYKLVPQLGCVMVICSGRKALNSRVTDLEQKVCTETAKRQAAEKELLQYRSQQSPVLLNKSETMQKMLSEIEQVKEEKRNILEWLERGVLEAERVSKQLSQISEAIHRTELFESDVKQTLQKLNNHHNELQQILHGMNMQIGLMQQDIDIKERNDSIQIASNGSNKAECDPFFEEYLIITKKVENLKEKCALLKKAEETMECLAACSRLSLHKLGKISVAVNSNSVWEDLEKTSNDSDSFDSEDGEADTNHPQIFFPSAKVAIDRCDSCLCTIWSGLSRFGFDQVHLRRQRDIQFQEACMAVERDSKKTVENCAGSLQELRDELEVWKNKQRLFERLVCEAESAYQSDLSANPFQREDNEGHDKGFEDRVESTGDFSDNAKRKALSLGSEHFQLKKTNDKLKRQLDVSMCDYNSVKELKHAYRDLEVRKNELAYVNEKLRVINRWMKQCAWEVDKDVPMEFEGRVP